MKHGRHQTGKNLFLALLAGYLATMILLLLFSFLMVKIKWPVYLMKAVTIACYVIAGFVSGFVMAKKSKRKKYLLGFCSGAVYFLSLFLISVIISHRILYHQGSVITVFLLCACGGMLGAVIGANPHRRKC